MVSLGCRTLAKPRRKSAASSRWKLPVRGGGHLSTFPTGAAAVLTDAGAQAHDAFALGRHVGLLKPLAPIIVGAEQAVGADVAVGRNLAQSAVELLLAQVQGIVVDLLAGRLESLQEQPDLSQIPEAVSAIKHARSEGRREVTGKTGWMDGWMDGRLPAAKFHEESSGWDGPGNGGGGAAEHLNLVVGQVVLLQVGDLRLDQRRTQTGARSGRPSPAYLFEQLQSFLAVEQQRGQLSQTLIRA